jgi:hypothetical protein
MSGETSIDHTNGSEASDVAPDISECMEVVRAAMGADAELSGGDMDALADVQARIDPAPVVLGVEDTPDPARVERQPAEPLPGDGEQDVDQDVPERDDTGEGGV